MDELDDFIASLEADPLSNEETSSANKIGDVDLDAEIEELFKEPSVEREQEESEEDDDDEEFTITGGGENLVKLGYQGSSSFKSPPVKHLVDKFNNPECIEKPPLLTPEEKPRRKSQELIPALQERNSDFKIKSVDEMKTYDASNVGKILNSNVETSDAEFLSWLSGSTGDEYSNKKGIEKKEVTPSKERVSKSALEYIQNLPAEQGVSGRRSEHESSVARMPIKTGLSIDVDDKKGSLDTTSSEGNTTVNGSHSPGAIKQFFDEMFGDDFGSASGSVMDPDLGKAKGSKSPNGKTARVGDDDKASAHLGEAKAYENEIAEIMRSPFPRVEELQEALQDGGYVPPGLRGAVWSLLLSSAVLEDHEVAFFKPSGKELSEASARALARDCDAIMKRHGVELKMTHGSLTQTRNAMYDLVTLFCHRRKTDYNPVHTQLLAPLLCLERDSLSRSQASSCFQALAGGFVPFLSTVSAPTALDHAVGKVLSWTRLLVSYHSPALAHHLDRVMPGWENAAHSAFGAADSELAQSRSDLEDLEKAYGLDDGLNETRKQERMPVQDDGKRNPQIASCSPQVLREKGGLDGGLIPLEWICGIFTCSVPPNQAILLLDWAVVNRERFAGVYLLAALLEIFREFLMHMDGEQVSLWMDDVANGRHDWFKSSHLPRAAYGFGEDDKPIDQYTFQQQLTWPVFVEGWVAAAAALRRSTPKAFRDALATTEQWAISTYGLVDGYEGAGVDTASTSIGADDSDNQGIGGQELKQQSGSRGDGNPVSLFDFASVSSESGNIADTTDKADINATSVFHIDDEALEKARPVRTETISSETEETLANSQSDAQKQNSRLLDSVSMFGRRLTSFALEKGAQLRDASTDRGSEGGRSGKRRGSGTQSLANSTDGLRNDAMRSKSRGRVWPHDTHGAANAICLWASAEEVNACICTSRRPVPVLSVLTHYENAVEAASQEIINAAVNIVNTDSDTDESGSNPVRIPNILSSLDKYSSLSPASVTSSHAEQKGETPFFFGIDCRTEAERVLGTFPKAISVDPSFITDPSSIADILSMLEPLAQSVHLCIIGSGEDYIKYMYEQQRLLQEQNQSAVGSAFAQLSALGRGLLGNSENESALQLESLLREYRLKLNAIAMFFLKRSFLHVSILEGGFMTAARQLRNRQVTPVSASPGKPPENGWGPFSSVLVDPHTALIDKILRGEQDAPASTSSMLQSKASAAAARVRASVLTTGSTLQSLARSNSLLTSSGSGSGTSSLQSGADADMDAPSHGVKSADEVAENLHGAAASSEETKPEDDGPITPDTGVGSGSGLGLSLSSGSESAALRAKSVLGGLSQRFSMFGESVRSTVSEKMTGIRDRSSSSGSNGSERSNTSSLTSGGPGAGVASPHAAFTIDDEYASTPGSGSRARPNTRGGDSASGSKQREEQALAMANHVMAGLRKGDSITISREALPGALLFPCTKTKLVKKNSGADGDKAEEGKVVSRFLVVSRERLIVLDSHGKGVGSVATVKSNHHLTQLIKMTFRKKDPNLVHLFYATGETAVNVTSDHSNDGQDKGEPVLKEKVYRLNKTKQFVSALQNGMKRFK